MKIKNKIRQLKPMIHKAIIAGFFLLLGATFFNASIVSALDEILEYKDIESEVKVEPTMKDWVLQEVRAAGLDPYDVYAIIQCESGWNDYAINVNTGGSVDRGLVQINNKWHPEVSDECAFNYKCSIRKMIEIRLQDQNYHQWVCAQLLNIN